MSGINELLEKLKAGELADELRGCETIDELVAKARELGYEVGPEDVEEATDLTDEALASIAGGFEFNPWLKCTC